MATSMAPVRPTRPNPRPTARPTAGPAAPASRPARPVPSPIVARRRRRALLTIAVVVGALVVVSFLGGRATADDTPSAVVAPAVYVVQPGDSLWSIAERLAPNTDLRPVVAVLKRAAGGSDVQAGQRIVLPPSLVRQ